VVGWRLEAVDGPTMTREKPDYPIIVYGEPNSASRYLVYERSLEMLDSTQVYRLQGVNQPDSMIAAVVESG
jgi:hypothetical protein